MPKKKPTTVVELGASPAPEIGLFESAFAAPESPAPAFASVPVAFVAPLVVVLQLLVVVFQSVSVAFRISFCV